MVVRRFQLDVSRPGSQLAMYARKGDSRVYALHITLVEGSTPVELTECTVALRAKKPDGTLIFNAGAVEHAHALCYLTSQTLTAEGVVRCQLDVYSASGDVLYSPSFDLYVEDVVADDSDIESESEFTALANAMVEYQNQKAAVDALAERIETILGQIGDNPLAEAISAVTYVTQTLTSEEKAVARGNIGAISADEVSDETTGKADKVASPTTGNFAGLDADGNLTDSGKKAADFATAAQGELAGSALQAADFVVANDLTTTQAGKVLDARQGKALNDRLTLTNTKLANSAAPYAHSKTGTVHNFVGSGKLGFAPMAADYTEGDSVNVNGSPATVVGDLSEAIADSSVLFSLTDAAMYIYAISSPFTVPDGELATPVNAVKTWVECAGIPYASAGSPSLATVVASETLMATLANSDNAMKYLIRSTTIQTAVLGSTTAIAALDASMPTINPQMTSNSQAGYITSGTYNPAGGECYKAFDSSRSSAWMCQPAGTNGTYSGYILLEMPNPVWCYRLKFFQTTSEGASSYNVYGSPDNVQWTSLLSGTGTPVDVTKILNPTTDRYKYIKVNVSHTYFHRLWDLRITGK